MNIYSLISRNIVVPARHGLNPSTASLIIMLLLLTLTIFPGCNNTTTTASPDPTSAHPASPNSPFAQANADYQAARYSDAYQTATKVGNNHKTNSQIHKQAAYIAGLSAYQLRRYDEAVKYLQPLRSDLDPEIAGNSSATLGLIAREQNHPAEAIILLKNAYRKLSGQDKAEAAYQTALSYRKLGQTAQARQQFLLARTASQDAQFRSRVDRCISNTGWTVQLGAFTKITNAQKRLAEYDKMTASRTLGPARILQQNNLAAHTTLYLVQVGNYMDYNLAARARTNITGPAVITTINSDNQ